MGKKGKIWLAGASAALVLFILFTAITEGKETYPSVAEISESWLNLKTHILTAHYSLLTSPSSLLSAPSPLLTSPSSLLTDFSQTVTRFAASPVGVSYRTHRSEEMRSLDNIGEALKSIETALQNNDSEALIANTLEIDKAVDTLQRVDTELTGPGQLTIFLLFVFFSLLIMIFVLVTATLKSKLDKEKKGHERSVAFSRETVIAQEQERERIAMELHDSVAQDLLRLSLQTEMIETAAPEDRSRLFAEVTGGHRELIRQIRNICEDLIPPDFHRRGLPETLQNLCRKFEQRTGIECPVSVHGNIQPETLDSETQYHCFRIVQECLANIEKHAQATEAPVLVRLTDTGELLLFLLDDGKGFSPPDKDTCYELREQGHLGLWNIFERAAFLHASLTIDSEAGEGTTITLKIPGIQT
jgi:signal transduction histidine kinase